MTVLVELLLELVVVVGLLNGVGALVVVGRDRLRRAAETVPRNLRAVAPTLVLLVAVLVINGAIRDIGVELSWLIGVNITGAIYQLEGQLVAQFQSLATPALTAYFDAMYIFGYVFLLTFPLLAYALADDSRPLRALLLTYAVNYTAGLLCYVLFIAYGPRNFMPGMVEPLLYTSWPEAQLLTSRVNTNTNVFPSLHTSLSVSVAALAYRYRSLYPRWTPVAVLLAASITASTMYLGIHWATDVVAGVVVAWLAVRLAVHVVNAPHLPLEAGRLRRALLACGHRTLQKLRRGS